MEKAGAKLCDKAKEVWDGVDMMVKVKEPLPEEYGYFRKDLLLLLIFIWRRTEL